MSEQLTTNHRSFGTLPKCDTCGGTATHGTMDMREIPSTDGVYREFEPVCEKRGCKEHRVVSMTTYLDGRVIATHQCVPEKITDADTQTNS